MTICNYHQVKFNVYKLYQWTFKQINYTWNEQVHYTRNMLSLSYEGQLTVPEGKKAYKALKLQWSRVAAVVAILHSSMPRAHWRTDHNNNSKRNVQPSRRQKSNLHPPSNTSWVLKRSLIGQSLRFALFTVALWWVIPDNEFRAKQLPVRPSYSMANYSQISSQRMYTSEDGAPQRLVWNQLPFMLTKVT
jgi:hypothetical protein